MGAEGVQEAVAEPVASVDVDGIFPERRVLLRGVLSGLLAWVDGGSDRKSDLASIAAAPASDRQ